MRRPGTHDPGHVAQGAGGGAAPERFAAWLSGHAHADPSVGAVYRYHSRSDAHSKELARLIWLDLLEHCGAMRLDHDAGSLIMKVNYRHVWSRTGKAKTIDLALGCPDGSGGLDEVRLSCELKAVMTEHGKSQPRVFDELSSSHQIVHQGNPRALAAGVTLVNIASEFVSPLRQRPGAPLAVSRHRQPAAAASMVGHLRGLAVRAGDSQDGFDAYCTIVIDCDNQGPAVFWTAHPAPQPGDGDHYATFLERLCQAYAERHP